jgi:hypothetical protein
MTVGVPVWFPPGSANGSDGLFILQIMLVAAERSVAHVTDGSPLFLAYSALLGSAVVDLLIYAQEQFQVFWLWAPLVTTYSGCCQRPECGRQHLFMLLWLDPGGYSAGFPIRTSTGRWLTWASPVRQFDRLGYAADQAARSRSAVTRRGGLVVISAWLYLVSSTFSCSSCARADMIHVFWWHMTRTGTTAGGAIDCEV